MKVDNRQRVIAVAAAAGALIVEASLPGGLRWMHKTPKRRVDVNRSRVPLRATPSRKVEPAPYSVKRHA
jgi:hypothetical protein